MSENKFDFSVESIISEIGIDEKFIRNSHKSAIIQEENEILAEEMQINYENELQNSDFETYAEMSKVDKKRAKIFDKKAYAVYVVMLSSLYLSVATIFGFKLPSFLILLDFPYVFMLVNAMLHILAMIISIEVIDDGIKNIFSPNINTLVSFSNIFILLQTLSVIFLENSLGFLPYTSVAIFTLFFAMKSLKFESRSKSYVYRICSMTSRLAFVGVNEGKKRKLVFKKITLNKEKFAKNVENAKKSRYVSIYFMFYVIFSVCFSIFIAKNNISMFLWCVATISALAVPINFIVAWSLPYKYASKKLFDEGIAIKSYDDIKSMARSNSILLSDCDLFPENSVIVEKMKLFGNNTEAEVISYVASGFSKLGSSPKYAFEFQLKKHYLKPLVCQKIDLIDENGFTFTVNNQKISVGNSKFVTSLGITVIDGFDVQNPVYVVISSQITAIISLKYTASPKMYNAISNLEQNSLKIIVSTLDFTINPNLIARVYDLPLKSIIFDDFLTRYHQFDEQILSNESILLTRQSGRTFINAFLRARKLVWSVKLNVILGAICSISGLAIASYLLYNFSPTVLLSYKILAFLFFWSIPTEIISFFYNKI